ncbi:MAG: hypothetical protein IPF98_04760 [Gemmatimonadetes bacterium]|nr:hypothetical protein [Gemmatimonadota bacterium]
MSGPPPVWTPILCAPPAHSAPLATHNIVRWLVLAAGVWAVFRVWRGWLSWLRVDRRADAGAVKLFVNTLSLQFVVGLVLYGVSLPIRGALEVLRERP